MAELRYKYITDEDYERAEAYGINRELLNQRVRVYGFDVETAISWPKGKKRNEVLTDEQREIARKNGLTIYTISTRVNTLGWPLEKAINTPIDKMDPTWRKYRELAKKNGIHLSTLTARVNRGWSMERAATTPPDTKHRRKIG